MLYAERIRPQTAAQSVKSVPTQHQGSLLLSEVGKKVKQTLNSRLLNVSLCMRSRYVH